jgi:hypothetical protein
VEFAFTFQIDQRETLYAVPRWGGIPKILLLTKNSVMPPTL